jgi:hypothetical protein
VVLMIGMRAYITSFNNAVFWIAELWIRIRKKVRIRIQCCTKKIYVKIKDQTREKSCFSIKNVFSLTYRFQNTYESN